MFHSTLLVPTGFLPHIREKIARFTVPNFFIVQVPWLDARHTADTIVDGLQLVL